MAGQSADGLYWVMVPPENQDDKDAGGDGTVKSVVVAAQILEALAGSGGPVRLADLSRQLGMPRARIHRHLKTLRELGFVSQERNGERYWLGSRLFHLGQAAREQFEITRIADQPMHALRDTFGQTIVLSTPINGEALIVAVAESENVVQISVRPGVRLSAPLSAQGRISLAYAPAPVQARILDALAAEERSDIEACLETIRNRLYEFSSGEMLGGINVLAAPLLGDGGELAGALAIVGAAQDVQETPEAVAALHERAAEISAKLGSTAYENHLKGL
jgi:IclR family transcriptional regulator, KDG regulon repressor